MKILPITLSIIIIIPDLTIIANDPLNAKHQIKYSNSVVEENPFWDFGVGGGGGEIGVCLR